jgi:hypothetical protein
MSRTQVLPLGRALTRDLGNLLPAYALWPDKSIRANWAICRR